MKRLKGHFGLCAVLACYAGGIALLLLWHLCGFAASRIGYAGGALATKALTVDDFELRGLAEMEDGSLLSTDGDPQLVLKDGARRVESVRLDITYAQDPVRVNVYWAAQPEAYSTDDMAWDAGGGRFALPAGGRQHLRIDPGTVAGNILQVNSIVINEKLPFWHYLVFTSQEILLLLVVPGLVACAASALHAAGLWPRLGRKKAGDAP